MGCGTHCVLDVSLKSAALCVLLHKRHKGSEFPVAAEIAALLRVCILILLFYANVHVRIFKKKQNKTWPRPETNFTLCKVFFVCLFFFPGRDMRAANLLAI